ncbi:hypothetical protein BO94DRAFT_544315 [Aspergillus sclerotioniger CBS 115572]|uniref:Uncharacterized protein n=1 Tax=Aspergillus sclerotioniger CBS 115572 TaxID=1450535 RepID=A0A317X3T4_9EURO|nr:hypothetical protein BO94DRAFT_544315 [Aspergillus sclerotioniger CBS 115572]PWY93294.1 hypothetical protein BO94DRAFT_544315 [Aspergillus sclerotioniger CBS 115572]
MVHGGEAVSSFSIKAKISADAYQLSPPQMSPAVLQHNSNKGLSKQTFLFHGQSFGWKKASGYPTSGNRISAVEIAGHRDAASDHSACAGQSARGTDRLTAVQGPGQFKWNRSDPEMSGFHRRSGRPGASCNSSLACISLFERIPTEDPASGVSLSHLHFTCKSLTWYLLPGQSLGLILVLAVAENMDLLKSSNRTTTTTKHLSEELRKETSPKKIWIIESSGLPNTRPVLS